MKTIKLFAFLTIIVTFSSCSKRDYTLLGNQSLSKTDNLKSFAFVSDGLLKLESTEWSATENAIVKEMRRKNYFYDSERPEILVFVSEFPEGVKFLTGNTYADAKGDLHLETGKVKTKDKTLFIQMVETQKYQTFWRGFSYANAGKVLPLAGKPLLSRAILNQ